MKYFKVQINTGYDYYRIYPDDTWEYYDTNEKRWYKLSDWNYTGKYAKMPWTEYIKEMDYNLEEVDEEELFLETL